MKSSHIQSRVALFVLACSISLQMPIVATAGHGEENTQSRTLRVTKECGLAALDPGELDYCTVRASNFRPLRGARIRYFGPGFVTGDHLFLDSWVVIESGEGDGTAFGHCLVRVIPTVLGACQFTGGSGSLKGFKADVTVTRVDNTAIWHWDGAISASY